jgi:hypothetical protein
MSEQEKGHHHGHHKHDHCEHHRHHCEHHRHHGGASCGHWGEGMPAGGGFRRRFFSREERIAELEQYLKDLQAEARGVEEELARLRAAG